MYNINTDTVWMVMWKNCRTIWIGCKIQHKTQLGYFLLICYEVTSRTLIRFYISGNFFHFFLIFTQSLSNKWKEKMVEKDNGQYETSRKQDSYSSQWNKCLNTSKNISVRARDNNKKRKRVRHKIWMAGL